ncbi:MAG: hypothetical protein ACXV8Q_10565 [Methylobacter sp.]
MAVRSPMPVVEASQLKESDGIETDITGARVFEERQHDRQFSASIRL